MTYQWGLLFKLAVVAGIRLFPSWALLNSMVLYLQPEGSGITYWFSGWVMSCTMMFARGWMYLFSSVRLDVGRPIILAVVFVMPVSFTRLMTERILKKTCWTVWKDGLNDTLIKQQQEVWCKGEFIVQSYSQICETANYLIFLVVCDSGVIGWWRVNGSGRLEKKFSWSIYALVVFLFIPKREPHSWRCQQMRNCSTRRRCWHSGPNCRSHQGTSCSCSPHHQRGNGKLRTWGLHRTCAGVNQASVWDGLVHNRQG